MFQNVFQVFQWFQPRSKECDVFLFDIREPALQHKCGWSSCNIHDKLDCGHVDDEWRGFMLAQVWFQPLAIVSDTGLPGCPRPRVCSSLISPAQSAVKLICILHTTEFLHVIEENQSQQQVEDIFCHSFRCLLTAFHCHFTNSSTVTNESCSISRNRRQWMGTQTADQNAVVSLRWRTKKSAPGIDTYC